MPAESPEECWSTHYHRYCLKYEVAVSLAPEIYLIVHAAGPFPGSMHDLTIARSPIGVASLLDEDERALADGAYLGDERFMAPFRRNQLEHDPERERWNRVIHEYRWKVEALNERLKNWRILSSVYRHELELHGLYFRNVCKLVNLFA